MTTTRPAHRALVVDDDAEMRRLLTLFLEKEGYAVETADDGREALERARSARPDLVLLDLRMPVLGGIEFLRVRRAERDLAAIPVLVLSSDPGGAYVAAALEADGFLAKPLDLKELRRQVGRLCPVS